MKKDERYYTIDGKKLPSVTTILSILSKPALIPWAVNQTLRYIIDCDISSGQLKEKSSAIYKEAKAYHQKLAGDAADIGSRVHDYINKDLRGIEYDLSNEDERLINCMNLFLAWKNSSHFEPVELEHIVYSHKYGYAGTLDAVGRSDNGLIVLDFKTSKGLYPEYDLQVAAYWHAYQEMTKSKVDSAYILRVGKEDAEFEVKEILDLDSLFHVFLPTLEVWKWKKSTK